MGINVTMNVVAWAVLAAIVMASEISVGAEGSLLPNGGFETLDGKEQAVGWSPSRHRGKGALAIQSAEVHDGLRAARISGEEKSFRGWFGSEVIPVEREGVYELSGWIKTEQMQQGAAVLGLYMLGRLKEWVGYSKSISVTKETDWTQYRAQYTVPRNVHFVGVRAWGEYLRGTAYFDDLSFVKRQAGLAPDAKLPDVSDDWLYKQWTDAIQGRSRSAREEECPESYGWVHSPYLRGLMWGYQYSRDPEWLELFVSRVDWLVSLLTTDAGGHKGWYGLPLPIYRDRETNAHSDCLVGEGLILFPMSLFVETVQNDAQLQATHGAKANEYRELIGELIRKWDARGDWKDIGDDEGVWVYPRPLGPQRRGMTLAKNQMCPTAKTCLVMWRLTRDDYYRGKAARVATHFKKKLIPEGEHLEWNYWEPAGPWDFKADGKRMHWVGRDHRSGYSAIFADFVAYAFHHGVVFTEDDVRKVVARQLHALDPKSEGAHAFWGASLAELDSRIMAAWYERIKSDPKWPSSWGGQSGVPMYLLKKRTPTGYAPLHVAK